MGTNEIPVKTPFPEWTSAPGVEKALFYLVDLSALSEEQRARLTKHLAERFRVDEQEVASMLDEVGCPILDEDITIVVHNPQKWMWPL